jgi:hypothetical protein
MLSSQIDSYGDGIFQPVPRRDKLLSECSRTVLKTGDISVERATFSFVITSRLICVAQGSLLIEQSAYMTTVIGIHSAIFWGQIQRVNKLDEYSSDVWIEQYVVLDMTYNTGRLTRISRTRMAQRDGQHPSVRQYVTSALLPELARMIAQARSP